MPGVILNGKEEQIPGLTARHYLEDPTIEVKIPEDATVRPRGTWIRAIVLHTTLGIPGGSDLRPQKVLPGMGPKTDTARNVTRFWSTNRQPGGAHIIIDFNGDIYCCADLETIQTYHATSVNRHTIGIEIAQRHADAALFEGQLQQTILLVDWLTRRFGIQRQYHGSYQGPIERLSSGGLDAVGIYGHRDQTRSRGIGDPGQRVMDLLGEAGYERFDFAKTDDKRYWSQRQADLKAKGFYVGTIDGVPGPATVAALRASGIPHGIFIRRPGD